jgi:putative phosphoesterase
LRFAVLSDIHGNLPALQAVLNDLNPAKLDGFILLGDYTGCPQAVETIQLLRELKGWMIQGNGEASLRRFEREDTPEEWKTYRQFGLLRWDHARLGEEVRDFLYTLPSQQVISFDGKLPIHIVHGSHRSPYEKISPTGDQTAFKRMLDETNEPVLICGHTHTPWKTEREGRLIFNPGAVCGPLDGSVGAQYALLSWQRGGWQIEHHRVDYNIQSVRRSFQESGLLEAGSYLARSFLVSIESGRNVADEFLTFAFRLKDQAGRTETEYIPDDIWEEAGKRFDWSPAQASITR